MRGFHPRSIADLQRAYAAGETTPREVCERAIASARALDRGEPPMRMFVALREAEALAEADAATGRWESGAARGALDGIPIAIKDVYDVAGLPTTFGARGIEDLARPVEVDAVAVRRLREAGAVVIGKTNLNELAAGPTGHNVHFGACRNPHDPARDPGGSSSGSAAAVAAGIVPIALGDDAGGSVRVPGAHCGVPALKGTFGRAPTEGIRLERWSLNHAAPIAATVDDVAAAFATMTGETIPRPSESAASVRAMRLGLCRRWWHAARLDVAFAVERALMDLARACGGRIVEFDLPHLDLVEPVGSALFTIETVAAIDPWLKRRSLSPRARSLGPAVRVALEVAGGMSALTLLQAQRARSLVVGDFERAFDAVDLIVTPTTATTAPRYREDALPAGEIDEARIRDAVVFTMPGNLTGLPAMQVPCGYDAEGMPIGMQIIARRGDDARALAAASVVERQTEQRRPAVWIDLLDRAREAA